VAGFELRLAFLVLAKPSRRRLLVLDEPWKQMFTQYRLALRELLTLAKEMAVKRIIVTHSSEFRMGIMI
jgi:ABC-type sulfate/molybdate transport systems ATPase subunit